MASPSHVKRKVLYATFADSIAGQLGRDYYIAKSEYGKGLFARHTIEESEIICAYDGDLIQDTRSQMGSRKRTHLLRVKDSEYIIDGYPMSTRLKFDKTDQKYWPEDIDEYYKGWGAIANSSLKGKNSNAKMIWLYNDRGRRPEGYNIQAQTTFPGRNIIPKQPYLIANKRILAGEEILWKYKNVELDDDDEIVDLTED